MTGRQSIAKPPMEDSYGRLHRNIDVREIKQVVNILHIHPLHYFEESHSALVRNHEKILVMVHLKHNFLDEYYLHAERPYIVCGSQKNSFLNNFLASRKESSKIKRIIPTPTPQPKARDQNSPTELFFSRASEIIHSESCSPERTIFYNQQYKIPQYETNLIHKAVSFPQDNIH